MTNRDKAANAVEKAKGTVKQKVGDATGDKRLQREGTGDKSKSDLKQAGEKVKDALKR